MWKRIGAWLSAALILYLSIQPAAVIAKADDPAIGAAQTGVSLRWLGNAGWEIRLGGTVILVDPFITRRDAVRGQPWRTDEAGILEVVTQADYIFVGHSHVDHVADVPFIARRFSSQVVGAPTTVNLALTAGVEPAQLTTVRGGETLDFEGFSVQVVESVHDVLEGGRRGGVQTIDRPLGRPIRGEDFLEGETLLYLFTFGDYRVLHQSTGNFLVDRLPGLQPDVVLMVPAIDDYDFIGAMEALNPRVILAHHFDLWRQPYSQGVTEGNLGRVRRFRTNVRAVNPQITVTAPQYFEELSLAALVGDARQDASEGSPD